MHTKDGTTIAGADPQHPASVGKSGDQERQERHDSSENMQGSGIEPDGEDDGSADVGAPHS